jgi:hypothetical protein
MLAGPHGVGALPDSSGQALVTKHSKTVLGVLPRIIGNESADPMLEVNPFNSTRRGNDRQGPRHRLQHLDPSPATGDERGQSQRCAGVMRLQTRGVPDQLHAGCRR